MAHKFYPEEIEKLRAAYNHLLDIRSEGNGSAFGEHYLIKAILREMGITNKFESSSQIENLTEYVLTYESIPEIY